mgnify:CR=1 FL=1
MKNKIIGIILWCLLILSVILLIFFCNKNIGYEVSELKPNSYLSTAHLRGTLKNVSNEDCKEVQIIVTFSSGAIKEDGWLLIESPKPGESISFNEILYSNTDVSNIEDYNIKLKKIKCMIEN